jgi:hypothetical protein
MLWAGWAKIGFVSRLLEFHSLRPLLGGAESGRIVTNRVGQNWVRFAIWSISRNVRSWAALKAAESLQILGAVPK